VSIRTGLRDLFQGGRAETGLVPDVHSVPGFHPGAMVILGADHWNQVRIGIGAGLRLCLIAIQQFLLTRLSQQDHARSVCLPAPRNVSIMEKG